MASKTHGTTANNMMLDSDQVHLLRPFNQEGDWQLPSDGVVRNDFLKGTKAIIFNQYVALPSKLGEVLDFFKSKLTH